MVGEVGSDLRVEYTAMGDAFAHAVLDDTAVPTPLEDAVNNMRVIEAMKRAEKSGQTEKV